MLEKLKSINLDQITLQSIKDRINKAIDTYDTENDITYQKLYDTATQHISDNESKIKAAADKVAQEEADNIQAEKHAKEKLEKEEEQLRLKAEQETKEKEEQEIKLKQKNMIENMPIPHLDYLKSLNKTIADTPREIRDKHKGWNMLYMKLLKNPNNENQKNAVIAGSEKLLLSIKAWEAATEDKIKADAEAKIQEERIRKEEEEKAKKLSIPTETTIESTDSETGTKIYDELNSLLKENKITLSLQDIKQFAPVSYKVIFDSYVEGQQNGIEVSNLKLMETEKEIFTLTN